MSKLALRAALAEPDDELSERQDGSPSRLRKPFRICEDKLTGMYENETP